MTAMTPVTNETTEMTVAATFPAKINRRLGMAPLAVAAGGITLAARSAGGLAGARALGFLRLELTRGNPSTVGKLLGRASYVFS